MKKKSFFICLLIIGGTLSACSDRTEKTEDNLVMEFADDPETIKANEQP